MATPKRVNSNRKNPIKKDSVVWHRHGLRIVHHRHSGRILPWHYTSYAILYFLILFTSFLIVFANQAVKAGQQTAQGSVTLGGTVNGPPPSDPAVITSPINNSRVKERVLNVEGDCTQNLFVEIYRNNSFAGMDLCDTNGRFLIILNLVPGENTLKARIKDTVNQYGPDSGFITVFYDVPFYSQERPGIGPIAPFLIYTSQSLHGTPTGVKFRLNYQVDGGKPPYAISIDWGDGTNATVSSLNNIGDFISDHVYSFSGQFTVRISGSDSLNTKAVIQIIVIAHDPNAAQNTVNTDCSGQQNCISPTRYFIDIVNRFIWPAIIIALLMTISFWIGERVVYTERQPTNKLHHSY